MFKANHWKRLRIFWLWTKVAQEKQTVMSNAKARASDYVYYTRSQLRMCFMQPSLAIYVFETNVSASQ